MNDIEKEMAIIRAGYIIAAADLGSEKRGEIMNMMRSGSTAGEVHRAVCPEVDIAVVVQVITEELDRKMPSDDVREGIWAEFGEFVKSEKEGE